MSPAVLLAALLLQQQPPPAQAAGVAGPAPAVVPDTGILRHPNNRVPPLIRAVRAAAGSIRLDGRLDEPVWSAVEPATGFTQQAPADGQPATERTEVRVAYDEGALYVGARMYDSEPSRIVAELGRRDGGGSDDHFEFSVDSYHDHRTAFFFKVNSLGVKSDAVYSDDGEGMDSSWDPVWEAATSRDSLGWTAEIRIPLSQLRYSSAPAQVWGIDFNRHIRRKGEDVLWAYRSRDDDGFSSFFGHVIGLENLPQPRRLEVLPYVTGSEERLATGTPGNPFNDGSRETGRAGVDIKYGLTSNLTLNATVNPDFGQVEADPAEVNLTAYETYFQERRPFFVEGANIFSGGNQQYFYSRRIGRPPQRSAAEPEGGFADQPTATTILGAAKLTGRTAGGWSVGLLEAATAREYATTVDSLGRRSREVVEPFTNYAVVRAQRDFRGGASTLGFIGTAVNRRIDEASLESLRSSAYAGGVDFTHRFSRNRFRLNASFGWSYIGGDTAAILLAQTSSARYYQRPDAGHVALDPARTSLMGWTGRLGFARYQGAWTYSVSASATSPGFEINDLGYQTRADRAAVSASLGRRWTRPGRVFQTASVDAYAGSTWNHGGDRLGGSFQLGAFGQFRSFWSVEGYLAGIARANSDVLARGGPLGINPAGWDAGLRVGSDGRRRTTLWAGGNASGDQLGGWSLWGFATVTWRPSATISLETSPEIGASLSPQQYVTSASDPTATAMFGRRYLFAEVLQHSVALTTRLNVTLSPTLSLQLWAQPFVATGAFREFKELEAPRTTDYLVYGRTPGSTLTPTTNPDGGVTAYALDPDGAGPRQAVTVDNPDFTYRSLRGNAVLRWEYRPGSTVFLVWTQACSSYGSSPAFNAAGDFRRLCQGRSDNVVAVKLNYWLSL
jgi:hypothetical protein